MAKYLGNVLTLKIETTPNTGTYNKIGAAIDHTYAQTSEAVDVSDKDTNRWNSLLTAGARGATISMNGWITDDTHFEAFREAWKTDAILYYQFEYGNAELVIGKFHVDSLELSGARNDAQGYSATLASAEELMHGTLIDFLLDEAGANLTAEDGQYLQGIY